jgi:hypothetical protein
MTNYLPSFSNIEIISEEPYVYLPKSEDFLDFTKAKHVLLNQQRRQKIKFDYFINTFDFLNDSKISGDYFEFGCHKVRTFRMALSCAKYFDLKDISFHAFDSFEGMPDFGNHLIDQWKPNELCTSEEAFNELVNSHGLYLDNIFRHKGYYSESLNDGLKKHMKNSGKKAIMITVDCDFYESAISVFDFIEPFIQHGTVIYLDDVFAGFKEESKGGVLKAFENFRYSSKYEYIPHMNIGWWGRSFIASAIK